MSNDSKPRELFFFCERGHVVIPTEAHRRQCPDCGSHVLVCCQQCEALIIPKSDGAEVFKPDFCDSCGKAFPWFQRSPGPATSLWELLHPRVRQVTEARFANGFYADAVEASFKELNSIVKRYFIRVKGREEDGVKLMHEAFSPKGAVIKVANFDTLSGQSEQQGYMQIFAGAMAAIRNPKAHSNIVLSEYQTWHFLMFASLLMNKLQEAGVISAEEGDLGERSHNPTPAPDG